MQEKGFSLPLNRSRYLLCYSILLHGLAMISVAFLTVTLMIKVSLMLLLIISLFRHLYLLGFIASNGKRAVALLHPEKTYWQIEFADSSLSDSLELESAWITRIAIIVYFKTPNKRRVCIVVVKDATDNERFRQLRVRLKLAFFRQ